MADNNNVRSVDIEIRGVDKTGAAAQSVQQNFRAISAEQAKQNRAMADAERAAADLRAKFGTAQEAKRPARRGAIFGAGRTR